MRRLYDQFRVLLFTLALGLASVWMWKGFEIGKEFVHVDLPSVRSEDVIQVFGVERRWMPIGGGSGPCGRHVSLFLENEANGIRTFRLGNYLDGPPIYVIVGRDGQIKSSDAVPYFLECLSSENSSPVVIPQGFRFPGKVRRLSDREHVEFSIPSPKAKGRCWVRVPYFRDATEIESFRLAGLDAGNWKDFERRTKLYGSFAFFNE